MLHKSFLFFLYYYYPLFVIHWKTAVHAVLGCKVTIFRCNRQAYKLYKCNQDVKKRNLDTPVSPEIYSRKAWSGKLVPLSTTEARTLAIQSRRQSRERIFNLFIYVILLNSLFPAKVEIIWQTGGSDCFFRRMNRMWRNGVARVAQGSNGPWVPNSPSGQECQYFLECFWRFSNPLIFIGSRIY